MEQPTKKVYLRDLQGIARKTGTCTDGCSWTEFTVDHGAEQEPGECSVCGAEGLEEGWLNLDDGSEEACHGCVVELQAWVLDHGAGGDLEVGFDYHARDEAEAEVVRDAVQSLGGTKLEIADGLLVYAIVPAERADEALEELEGFEIEERI